MSRRTHCGWRGLSIAFATALAIVTCLVSPSSLRSQEDGPRELRREQAGRRGPPPGDSRRQDNSTDDADGSLRPSDGRDRRGPPPDRDPNRGPGDSRGPPGFPGSRFDGTLEGEVSDKGFLFIDGEYIPPPYKIVGDADSLKVNDRELTCLPPPRESMGRGFGPRPSEVSVRYWFGKLQSQLALDYVVMSFPNQPCVELDSNSTYDFLKSIIATESRSVRQVALRDQLPLDFDRKVWDSWLETFVPPGPFAVRAAALANTYERNQQQALNDIQARRLLDRLAYPMTVSGMVLSVLALGHLLGGRPHAGKQTLGLDASPEMIRTLNWSLAFTTAFSLLDLVWTILTLSTNDVRELNPIGKQFIHDPRHLAGFKVALTFSCLALLWLLRKHKRAQIAAWWLCLVLTLVTCRWLLVDTLIVSAE